MPAGLLRRADPALVVALCYATVTGIATEPEALSGGAGPSTPTGLRHLRGNCSRSCSPHFDLTTDPVILGAALSDRWPRQCAVLRRRRW